MGEATRQKPPPNCAHTKKRKSLVGENGRGGTPKRNHVNGSAGTVVVRKT